MRWRPAWLSPIDSWWWQMDHPTNLAYVHFLFAFDRLPDYPAFLELLETRLLVHRRFRCRVARAWRLLHRPRWQEDPNFELHAHVFQVGMPLPGDDAALRRLVCDLSSRPFPANRSPWEMFLIARGDGGGGFLFGRLHHCLADGVALMQLLAGVVDDAPLQPAYEFATSPGPAGTVAGLAGNMARGALSSPMLAAEAAAIIFGPTDSSSGLKAKPLGVAKGLAWTGDLGLDGFLALAQAHSVTGNDLLLSLIAGALRRYLTQGSQSVEKMELRPFMPVNLRDPAEAVALGNGFGLLLPLLPLHIADPVERLHAIHDRMETLKRSRQGEATYATMAGFGLAPKPAQALFQKFMRTKCSMVITNLIGPQEPCVLAGRPVRAMVFWAPPGSLMPLSFSAFSYRGRLQIGIQSDAATIPEPVELVEHLEAEWAAVRRVTVAREHSASRSRPKTKPGKKNGVRHRPAVPDVVS